MRDNKERDESVDPLLNSRDEPRQRKPPTYPGGRCKATTKHGKNAGNRCQRPAIKGGTVCWKHGGAAKQVKKKARQRLDESADKLMAELLKIAFDEQHPVYVRLQAIRDALDRAGFGAKHAVAVKLEADDPFAALVGDVLDIYDDGTELELTEKERKQLESSRNRDREFALEHLKKDAESDARREWADLDEDDEDRARRHVGLTRVVEGEVVSPTPNPNGEDRIHGPIDQPDDRQPEDRAPDGSEYDPRPDRSRARTREQLLRERLDLPDED